MRLLAAVGDQQVAVVVDGDATGGRGRLTAGELDLRLDGRGRRRR